MTVLEWQGTDNDTVDAKAMIMIANCNNCVFKHLQLVTAPRVTDGPSHTLSEAVRFMTYGPSSGTRLTATFGAGPVGVPPKLVDAGTHTYAVTFVSSDPNLGESAAIKQDVNVAIPGQVKLGDIPVGVQDEQVAQRKIYRTKANTPGRFYYVDTLADNIATTYDDKTPDGSLGPEAALKFSSEVSTHNVLENVIIGGNALELQNCVRIGGGNDANNDFHELRGCDLANYGNAGVAVEGTQAFGILIDNCRINGQTFGEALNGALSPAAYLVTASTIMGSTEITVTYPGGFIPPRFSTKDVHKVIEVSGAVWAALNGAPPLTTAGSAPFTGTTDGITYTVTTGLVTSGVGSFTYTSTNPGDPSGSGTAVASTAAHVGTAGLTITFGVLSIASGAQYRIKAVAERLRGRIVSVSGTAAGAAVAGGQQTITLDTPAGATRAGYVTYGSQFSVRCGLSDFSGGGNFEFRGGAGGTNLHTDFYIGGTNAGVCTVTDAGFEGSRVFLMSGGTAPQLQKKMTVHNVRFSGDNVIAPGPATNYAWAIYWANGGQVIITNSSFGDPGLNPPPPISIFLPNLDAITYPDNQEYSMFVLDNVAFSSNVDGGPAHLYANDVGVPNEVRNCRFWDGATEHLLGAPADPVYLTPTGSPSKVQLNWGRSKVLRAVLTGATDFNIAKSFVGFATPVRILVTHSAGPFSPYAVTWATTLGAGVISWASGAPAAPAAGKTDIFEFLYDGTTVFGMQLASQAFP
jgi:hypothetical protein